METKNRVRTFCRKASVATTVGAGALLAAPAVSHAQVTIPADPTGGYMEDAQASVQTWALTVGVPALFGLTLVGILIRMGRRWMRKAGSSV